MKKYIHLIGAVIFLGAMIGCSEKPGAFDDQNIIFEIESNMIEITNETGFDLGNLSLKISEPLSERRSNSNAERKTVKFIEEFNIKTNETEEIAIPLPLQEGIEAIDLDIDFNGKVIESNEKVPFEIGGSLSALAGNPSPN